MPAPDGSDDIPHSPSAVSDRARPAPDRAAHYKIASLHFATDIPTLCSCPGCVYNHALRPPHRVHVVLD